VEGEGDDPRPGWRDETEWETITPEDFTDRYSTGVVSFDSILKGGVPIGSLVLMLTDEGAGAREFAFTSAAKLSLVRDKPDMMRFVFGDFYSHMQMPKSVTYISISRTRMDVQMEIDSSFNPDLASAFERHVEFLDFSPLYFQGTRVPIEWITDPLRSEAKMEGASTLIMPKEGVDIFSQLIEIIEAKAKNGMVEAKAKNGMVFVDSLTDLIINRNIDNQDTMVLLKGLQRVLPKWRGVVFFLLHAGTLPSIEESQFRNCFDAVMDFDWIKSQTSSKRQRYMHFEKFQGVLPVLDRESIVRFNTEVSYASGFVVVNAERIV
jgi:KaiC/GvpD/RAD55 family RecA-like ATPase